MMKKLPLIITLLFSHFIYGGSKCLLVEVPFHQRVEKSELIIEGSVTSQKCFRERGAIYTLSTVSVSKIYKGNSTLRSIDVITVGGTIDDETMTTTSLLQLYTGERGIFFLERTLKGNGLAAEQQCYMVYSGLQGFVTYDDVKREAHDPFSKYTIQELNEKLISLTGKRPLVLTVSSAKESINVNIAAQPVITGFSPTIVSAGTGTILTITGNNFGSSQGRIDFPTANSEGQALGRPRDTEYISWSDTEIKVKVPNDMIQGTNTRVGSPCTGTFFVSNANNETNQSPTPLTIIFSVFNTTNSLFNQTTFVQHIDENGTGGYTFEKNSSIANNTGANAAFDRAMKNWICNTGINWNVSSTLTPVAQIFNDGINTISFDTNDPLPAGTLGTGNIFISTCVSGGQIIVRAVDCDIVFNDVPGNFTWNFGPTAPTATEVDFETVALHELGHLLLLDHVVDPTSAMHVKLAAGVSRRILSANDRAGGAFVTAEALTANGCGQGQMALFTEPTATIDVDASGNPSCMGSTVTFTATVTNAPGAVFQWKKNGVNVGTNSPTFVTSSLVNNDHITCTVTVTSLVCPQSATDGVSVTRITTPAPSTISGTACITNGTATTYACSSVPSATAYNWSGTSGITFNGSTNAIAVSVTTASTFVSGTLSVIATANGCASVPKTFLIRSTPAQPATITGQATGFCNAAITNQPYSIAAVPNTSSYAWTGTTGMTINSPSTGTNITANFSSAFAGGTLSVVAKNGSSCNSIARTLTIDDLPAQPGTISGPGIVNPSPSGAVYSIASVFGADSYTWSGSSGANVFSGQGTTSAQYIFTSNGNKSICVRSINDCGQSSQRCKTVTVGFAFRTTDVNDGNYNLFPNPASTAITFYKNSGEEMQQFDYVITDVTGRVVDTYNNKTSTSTFEINIEKYPAGIYSLTITEKDRMKTLRFVKE